MTDKDKWRVAEAPNKARLKEGFEKFREALEQDAKEAAKKGSGLPRDWRDRIIR